MNNLVNKLKTHRFRPPASAPEYRLATGQSATIQKQVVGFQNGGIAGGDGPPAQKILHEVGEGLGLAGNGRRPPVGFRKSWPRPPSCWHVASAGKPAYGGWAPSAADIWLRRAADSPFGRRRAAAYSTKIRRRGEPGAFQLVQDVPIHRGTVQRSGCRRFSRSSDSKS